MTQLSRRHFLKVSAAGTATAILAGCGGERWVELVPYVVAPEEQLAGVPTYFASTCRMCPAACGILVKTMNGRAIKIEGNPEHPISRGRTCARGQSGLQLLYNPDRITGAVEQEERGSRRYRPLAWNDGINRLYERLNEAGSRVAIWLGSATSGHLVDLFTLFADAIGAPAPVRYDLYAAYHGYDVLQAVSGDLLGSAALPAYDLARADAIFSFGADYLGTWLNATAYNVAYSQFRSQPYGRRGYFVQFEPRMTNTGAAADRWVPVRPGDEALVAQALVRLIADEGFGPAQRVEAAQAVATEVDVEAAAAACHLTAGQLAELARAFAEAERPVALPGAGLAGRDNAAAAVAAVQALNVIAGTIGQAGGLSLAQGIEDAGLLPVATSTFADAQALVARMQAGEVDVLLVHGANPVYDMPAALGVVEALENVGMVVSFSPMPDETAVYADLVLPDRVYLEGWGYEVATPAQGGLPVVSSQQPVVGPLHDARSTADVLLTVARGIGAAAAALPWADEVAFIRERVTALPAAAYGGEGADLQWARFQQFGGWWPGQAPESALPEVEAGALAAVGAAEYQGDEGEYPYHLHLFMSPLLGDGHGASIPWLQGSPDPMTTVSWQTWVEINPATAEELGIEMNDVVRVSSPFGTLEAPAYIYPAIRPDTLAIPLGQGHSDYGRYARDRGANPVRLLGAEPGANGGNLMWSNVRVKVERTGDAKALARFETTIEEASGAHPPI